MSKLTLDIPNETTDKLKIKAKEHRRSLTQEIIYLLEQLTNDSTILLDTTVLPEDTTIKTKTQKVLTSEEVKNEQIASFQKLAKAILGKPLVLAECTLTPDMTSYYDFAEKEEGKFIRMPYTMPREKQEEYIMEWKEYLKQ
jgi:plasmid stability protein